MSTVSFWGDVCSGVVGNIVTAVLGAVVVTTWGLLHLFSRRRRAVSFFGLTRESPGMIVYHSTLFVRNGGAADFRDCRRSFQGQAIPAGELSVVPEVGAVFRTYLLDRLPPSARAWLASRTCWWWLGDISTAIKASPKSVQDVGPGTILSLGSPAYNSVTYRCAATCDPFLRFDVDVERPCIMVTRGPRKGECLDERRGTQATAMLEKLHDTTQGSTVFVAAGHGEHGTMGAAQYLLSNWERLHREFGSHPFALYLLVRSVGRRLDVVELGRFSDVDETSSLASGRRVWGLPR